MEDEKVVYAFARNSEEEIRFTLRQYKARHYLDVRLWYQPQSGGEYRPTRKGITFALDHLSELRKGLDKAGKASQELTLQPTHNSIE